MTKTDEKMVLKADAMAEIRKAQTAATGEFLHPDRQLPNVVGMGAGIKWSEGQPTGEPALVVLVTQKVEQEHLTEAEMVPSKLEDMQTDVLTVGYPVAGEGQRMSRPAQLTRRGGRVRGGFSVGHVEITAGTVATGVYDILPDGHVSPPQHGLGIPSKYYILSNNHVLANSNEANVGDPCLHPGPFDGGVDPDDRVATLSRWIPITFDPPVPRSRHRNLVDAAIAQIEFDDLDREVYWAGHIRGWRRKSDIEVGTVVQKTGRTTGYTVGRVTAVDATIDVNYGGGRIGRFVDQIVTTNMSAGGDSGSLITTLDNVAIGLLFAGSSAATIVNHIENVRSLLRVEVAEQILAP